MTRKWKSIISLLVTASLSLGLGACSSSEPEPAANSDPEKTQSDVTAKPAPDYKELTIYTGLPENEIPYIFTPFEEDTGIKINYVRQSGGELYARIKAEAAHPQASLLFCVASDIYMNGVQENLFEDYQSPELENVAEKYLLNGYDFDGGAWNPFCVTTMALACNRDWFQKNNLEYPKTWDDLLKPEFKGQITMPHPTTSGMAYTILSTILQKMGEEEGWEYLKKLDENIVQYTKAGGAAPMSAALGEAAIALTLVTDGMKPVEQGYPVDVVIMDDEVGYEVLGIMMLKNGPEKEQENAKTFIDWLLSERGQECMQPTNRAPVNSKAKVSDDLVSVDEVKTIEFDFLWSGENRDRLIGEFSEKIDNAQSLKE